MKKKLTGCECDVCKGKPITNHLYIAALSARGQATLGRYSWGWTNKCEELVAVLGGKK